MILENRPVARATGLIIVASCSFGSLSTLTLLLGRDGISLVPAMVWRYLLAGTILVALLRGSILRIERRQAIRLMLVGCVGQAVITYLSLSALKYIPVGPLGFLFYTYPAWVAVIAAVTGREVITMPRALALATAMAGIVVMVGIPSATSLNATGVLLALGTAFLYAVYLPELHKAQEGVEPLVSAFYLVCGVFAAFLVGALLSDQLVMPETAWSWGLLVMLSLIGTVVAFIALIAGMRTLGPLRTSIISTVEPFFTVLLGVFLLGEAFTSATLLGGIMIAGAVLLLQRSGRERASSS